MIEWGTLWTFVAMSWVLFISFGFMWILFVEGKKQFGENKKEDN